MNLSFAICRFLWHQPWFKAEYGRAVYKRICQHGDPPDYPFTLDFFGLRYQGNLRNTIDFKVFYYGAFEKPLLFFLRDCLAATGRPPTVFCDIGANIGQHALFMSQLADRVHAFEPFAAVREKLERHITLNNITNLTVHPVGLSDQDQSLPFFAPTGRNQGIGSFDASSTAKGNRNIGDLQLVHGDSYFSAQKIGKVDLIKIDVEGFEKIVLKGLVRTLADSRPVVVFELTYGKDLSIASMDELVALFPAGYEFLTFDTRKPDGRKARRREEKARRTGQYRLVPFHFTSSAGQDDIIACPGELTEKLPKSSPS